MINRGRLWVWLLLLVNLLLQTSCVSYPQNPSFAVSRENAQQSIETMKQKPVKLERPLVILGGYLDVMGAIVVQRQIEPAFNQDQIIAVTYPLYGSDIPGAAKLVLEQVEKSFPNKDANFTTEVDVIGISMGCLVARYAAAPSGLNKRLHIHRLFSMSGPHQGAVMSKWALFGTGDVFKPDSALLLQLNNQWRPDYPIFPYVRLGDATVGVKNAAPIGEIPWWTDKPLYEIAHSGVVSDPKILADIMLRLRGEPPFTSEPRAPIPEGWE